MLLRLIADDDGGLTQESIEKAISMINMSAGLKNVTHGFIDINKKTRRYQNGNVKKIFNQK